MKKLAIAITYAALSLPSLAHANEPRSVGTFGEWKAYTRFDGNAQICYALTKAKSKTPRNVNHGEVYFMVASWKSGAATEQPSLITGYNLKSSSPPGARVGSSKFPMYVSQNEAFIESNSDERKLVKSMRAGSTMRVSALSVRGTATNYSFSLSGVTAALKKVKSSCG
jgi:hypothetical protein